jgi:hypothetical protein
VALRYVGPVTSDDGGDSRSLSAARGARRSVAAARFGWVLGAIAVAGMAVRAAYVVAVADDVPLGNDATWYFLQSGSIADGLGYIDPEQRFATGAEVATAGFPPLYPAWLAAVRLVGVDSVVALQLAGAVTGAATIVLTGLLGRRLAGPTVGLVAAGLAALSPMLVAGDGSLMTETIYVPVVLLLLLLADRARVDGTWGWWIGLGAACGAAALTRQEALGIIVVVVLPAAILTSDRTWAWRIGRLAVAGAAIVVVLAPWVVRNHQQVGTAAISTASPATSLAGANCDATYAGPSIGSWEFTCTGSELRTRLPEAEWTDQVRADALRYARDHAGSLVIVAPARAARVWGLWDPSDLVRRDADETRSQRFQYVVWGTGIVTLVAGIAGIAVLARRGGRVAVLVGPLALVALTAVASYGNPRFRTVAEPALLIGVAVLVVTAGRAWRREDRPSPG